MSYPYGSSKDGTALPQIGTSFSSLSQGLGSTPPPLVPSSLDSRGSGANVQKTDVADLQKITPARGRLGIEEIPFLGVDPVPTLGVPPPPGGWGPQVTREDDLQRFTNRNTQGIDGGGRSTNYTRFQPQLQVWQQTADQEREQQFTRNSPSAAKTNQAAFP